jgi:hypothetical protein
MWRAPFGVHGERPLRMARSRRTPHESSAAATFHSARGPTLLSERDLAGTTITQALAFSIE